MSTRSSLVLVLHAHLPYIRQPEKPWGGGALEEDWYFEAVAETYVPLIAMIDRLAKDNIRPALTISLSPTLCALMEDELLEKTLQKVHGNPSGTCRAGDTALARGRARLEDGKNV